MTWRLLLIDGPAAIVTCVAAAVLWLDDHVTRLLTLVWYAYWIVVATGALLCLVAAALTVIAFLLGLPMALGRPVPLPVEVVPAGGRAVVDVIITAS
jgi:hypothetical protein